MRLVKIAGRGNENLYRDPKTEIIYFSIYRAGKGRVRRSTGTKALTNAKVIADGFRMEFLGETRIKRGRKTAYELYLEWVDQKRIKAPNTIASIENSGKHFEPYLSHMFPTEITAKWWESVYIPEKRAVHAARKFFNDRKWLTMFLISLRRDGVIESIPKLINPDPEISAGHVFSNDECQRLLANAGDTLKLQILMAVTMGMRIGEIMNLTWDRIDLKKRVIHLRAQDTKIRKARSFGISDSVEFRLRELKLKAKGNALFPSPLDPNKPQGRLGNKTAWTSCRRNAKVSGRFHDLRHTFLTNAFKKSLNPALICHYAGLSLEEAQRTYLHFTVEDTRNVASLVEF